MNFTGKVLTFAAFGILLSLSLRADLTTRTTPIVKAVAAVMPSVVNLSTQRIVADDNSEADDNSDLLGNGMRQEHSLGSGSIIDPAGLVVTSEHVVKRAAAISVTLADGTHAAARKLAGDEINDIALLQIVNLPAGRKLTTIHTAIPGDILLGERIIVVGNPYGLGNSIASGVVSAIGRKIVSGDRVIFDDILQIDAMVYPGNSGGPLINIDAEMIGISTALHREAQGGISFAIPIQRVANTLSRWLIPERFNHAALGITPACERHADGKIKVFLQDVMIDSPAWKAGLRSGDELISANGVALTEALTLSRIIWRLQPGATLTLQLADRREIKVQTEPLRLEDGRTAARNRLGLGIRPLTPALANALDYPLADGVIVSDPGRPVSGGLSRGDLLVQVGDMAIHTPQDIAQALRDKFYGDTVPVIAVGISKQENGYYLTRKIAQLKVK